jgi:hypothetical protein
MRSTQGNRGSPNSGGDSGNGIWATGYEYNRYYQNIAITGGKFVFHNNDATLASCRNAVSTTSVNDGVWHHVAATKASATLKVYVDGQLEATSTATTYQWFYGPNNRFYLGSSGTQYSYAGDISEFRMWNTERSQQQIVDNMSRSLGPTSNLVLAYRFDQGIAGGNNSTSTVIDYSGNSRNGTLSGFSLNGRSSNWILGLDPDGYGVLDNVSATIGAAYSTRRLKSGYSGYAMRVRRSSDGAEADVAFNMMQVISPYSYAYVTGNSACIVTKSGGSLVAGNITSLSSFGSATNCYVVTWYDQSGNGNNATQSNAASQPMIVNNGTLVTYGTNAQAAVDFGVCDWGSRGAGDDSPWMAFTSLIANVRSVNFQGKFSGFVFGDDGEYDFHRGTDDGQSALWHSTYSSVYVRSTNGGSGVSYVDGVRVGNTSTYMMGSSPQILTCVTGENVRVNTICNDRLLRTGGAIVQDYIVATTPFSMQDRVTLERDQGVYYGGN